jgi:hypothetical protein
MLTVYVLRAGADVDKILGAGFCLGAENGAESRTSGGQRKRELLFL